MLHETGAAAFVYFGHAYLPGIKDAILTEPKLRNSTITGSYVLVRTESNSRYKEKIKNEKKKTQGGLFYLSPLD